MGEEDLGRDVQNRAARMTANLPEQRYLELRAARLHQPGPANLAD